MACTGCSMRAASSASCTTPPRSIARRPPSSRRRSPTAAVITARRSWRAISTIRGSGTHKPRRHEKDPILVRVFVFSWLFISSHELIPRAVHGQNVLRLVRRRLDLLPQFCHEVVDRAGGRRFLVAPHLIQN